jgi:nitrate reductase gamma subunit
VKPSTRLLIVLLISEALLAGIWIWLVSGIQSGSLKPVGTPAEAIETMSSTMGTVMGVVAGIGLVSIFLMRRKGN